MELIKILSVIPFWLIGFLVFFYVAKGKRFPMDESNRINHIRLIWWSITKPEYFTDTFEWLKKDEGDNFNI